MAMTRGEKVGLVWDLSSGKAKGGGGSSGGNKASHHSGHDMVHNLREHGAFGFICNY